MGCVHILLLSFVVSPSVQPSLPHVSHSPAGTPASAAVHAGILHSCHTYVKEEEEGKKPRILSQMQSCAYIL